MNEFEKYIRDNKNQLEPDKMDPKVWMSIENKMLKSNNRRKLFYWRTIAATALLLLGSYFAYNTVWENENDIEANLIAQFDLQEHKFTQKVNSLNENLSNASVPENNLEDFEMLLQQLKFLDKQFEEYMVFVDQNGYQEFIKNQIVNHYKTKINLLEKIQKEVEKINYYENKVPTTSKKVEINI